MPWSEKVSFISALANVSTTFELCVPQSSQNSCSLLNSTPLLFNRWFLPTLKISALLDSQVWQLSIPYLCAFTHRCLCHHNLPCHGAMRKVSFKFGVAAICLTSAYGPQPFNILCTAAGLRTNSFLNCNQTSWNFKWYLCCILEGPHCLIVVCIVNWLFVIYHHTWNSCLCYNILSCHGVRDTEKSLLLTSANGPRPVYFSLQRSKNSLFLIQLHESVFRLWSGCHS